jgi:hypothetical protein
MDDSYIAAQLQFAIRRELKRQSRFLKAHAKQRRQWLKVRDGSAGAAGPCRRLYVDADGELRIDILEPDEIR